MVKFIGYATIFGAVFVVLIWLVTGHANAPDAPDIHPATQVAQGQQQVKEDAPATSGDTIQYDQRKADAIAAFDTIDENARECMHDNALMGLRQGARSRELIVAMSVRICAGVLLPTLEKNGESEKEANAYAEAMAYDELNKVLPDGQ